MTWKGLLVPGVSVVCLAVAVPAAAQEATRFFAISELQPPPDAQPQLMGAQVADPKDFPASFYSGHQGGMCTSTLVGPRVLLTAAHCLGSNGVARITVKGQTINGRCTSAPEYATNRTADWALCAFDADVNVPFFERVNTDPNLIQIGTAILLTGFGCTKPDGSGGNDGVYRKGEAPVVTLPAPPVNDVITRGTVAVCFGDSGGPAFLLRAQQPRVVVSVNSRGNIQDESYLASTSTAAAQSFLRSWSSGNGLKICGLHQDAAKCRNVP